MLLYGHIVSEMNLNQSSRNPPPTLSRRCGTWLYAALTAFFVLPQAHGQGTVHVTFDWPAPQPPGTAVLTNRYDEGGMSFTPVGPVGFVRQGGSVSFYPENGTTYLQAGLNSTLRFGFTNGTAFDLVSVDLAEYSTVFPVPATVHFVGYHL